MNAQRQIDRLIAERAAEWVEALRHGRTETYPEFVKWVGESPRHLREFMAMLALRKELPGAFARAGIDRDALLSRVSSNITELQNTPAIKVAPLPEEPNRRAIPWRFAAAAAVIAMTATALWIANRHDVEHLSTSIGEQRTITLADGSLLYLNANSATRIRITEQARDIELVAGEALFQVARDPSRPFRVHTRDAVVRAIGTRFNVDTRAVKTVVSVLEGKVEVSSGSSAGSRREPLRAGEAAEITRSGKVRRQSGADTASADSWRERVLVFSKTPLEEVAVDFNRFHAKGRLLLEGVDASTHHYTGRFNADDVASFAAMLAREPDLVVEKTNGDYVVRRIASPAL